MDINGLINSIEVELDQAQKKRDQAIEKVKFMLATVSKEGRAGFSKEEREEKDRLQAIVENSAPEIAEIQERLSTAHEAKENELKIEKLNEQRTQTKAADSKPSYDRVARVGQEERTYHKGSDPYGRTFVNDVVRQFLFNDLESSNRLNQHMREERVERAAQVSRSVGTGAFAGLVVPQYLTDMYAPNAKARRPFADICRPHPLPENGMTVNISKITTGTSVGLQANELDNASEQNMDDTLLTESIQTAAGRQTLSRQALERGTGIEAIVLDDLLRSYQTTLDSTLINQATTGLSALSVANTYTQAGTPLASELYPKIIGAGVGIETAMLELGEATHVVMHPRRWGWLQAQLTSTWPAFGQPGIPTQNMGVNNGAAYNTGVRGVLPNGLLVVTDANIATNKGAGTNEDEIYVVNADECHLWEDPSAPVFLRAEQPQVEKLGVVLVVYGYFAYTFRRFSNIVQNVSGTGLKTPTF